MISSPKRPPTEAAPANVTARKLDTNEQAQPLTYFSGRQWRPVLWCVSHIYNPTTKPVTAKVGKKTQTTGYEYGGDVAGLVSLGAVDKLAAIEVDGEIVWSAVIERDGVHVNATGPIVVPSVGTFNLVWGTETQTDADFLVCNAAAPEEHPYYAGVAVFEAQKLAFGQGRTNVPNVRVLVERAPRFAGLDESLTYEGVSLVTALAEVLGNSFYGAGRPDLVDVPSWSATSATVKREQVQPIPGDPDHVAAMGFGSPYMESPESLQSFAGKILENFDGWIRSQPGTGKLELGHFPHDGVVPDGLPELTLHDCYGKPQFASPGWSDDQVLTDVVVKHVDRDWNMETVAQPAINTAARKRLGEVRRKTFDRLFIHTSYQGRAQANELVKFYGRPEISLTQQFRREKVATLRPGDRFIFNYGPSAFRQLCRVNRRRDPGRGGSIELTIVAERGLAPLGYVAMADPAPVLPEPPAPTTIVAARVLQLPIAYLDDPAPAVAVLASRPSTTVLGYDVYFSDDDVSYDPIAQVKRWAVHGALAAAITNAAAAFNVTAAGPDLEQILQNQSEAAQLDNTLLLVCGYEIMSIGAVVAVGGGTYNLTVLRGVLGSAGAAHNNGDEIFIIPRADLEVIQHASFPRATANRYFKLRSFTPQKEQALADALRLVVLFDDTAVDQPQGFTATGKAEAIFLAWDLPKLPDGRPDSTIAMVEIFARPVGSPVPGANESPDHEALADGFHLGGLAAGTQLDFWIRFRDTINDKGPFSPKRTATALAATKGDKGDPGIPGPGFVYVGPFVAGTVYYCTTSRIDVVSKVVGGITYYYRAIAAVKSGGNAWTDPTTPGQTDWSAADATYKFVATDFLLVRDQTILKTLVMGDGTQDAGIFRSYGATAFGIGDGYWFNPKNAGGKTEVRIGKAGGNRIEHDGTNLKMYSDYTELGSSFGTKMIFDQDPGFSGPGTAGRMRFGALTIAAISPTQGSIDLTDGTIGVSQGNGFKIGNFVGPIGGGAWWGVQTQVGGEARFPGNLKTSGDMYLGMNAVNRYMYDCNGNRILQYRYPTGNPGASLDPIVEWCRQVIIHHGLGA